jgi:uncharacterized protein YggE
LALVVLAVVAGLIIVKQMTPQPVDRVFSVSADGKVVVKPDTVQLRIGVVTQPQKTAADAVRQGNEQMTKVVDALKAVGVKAEEMQTTGYNLNPRYTYANDRGQQLDGYELYQELSVKMSISESNKTSEVLAAATGAGANQVGDIQFVVDDPDAARMEARREAINKAKIKARQLSSATGMHLGRIVDVLEDSGGVQPPMYYARDAVMGMGGTSEATPAPAVEVGQNEITVTMTLVYRVR